MTRTLRNLHPSVRAGPDSTRPRSTSGTGCRTPGIGDDTLNRPMPTQRNINREHCHAGQCEPKEISCSAKPTDAGRPPHATRESAELTQKALLPSGRILPALSRFRQCLEHVAISAAEAIRPACPIVDVRHPPPLAPVRHGGRATVRNTRSDAVEPLVHQLFATPGKVPPPSTIVSDMVRSLIPAVVSWFHARMNEPRLGHQDDRAF